jgi:hypothetical protein
MCAHSEPPQERGLRVRMTLQERDLRRTQPCIRDLRWCWWTSPWPMSLAAERPWQQNETSDGLGGAGNTSGPACFYRARHGISMVACGDRAPISAMSGGATEPLDAMQEPSWQSGRRCVFRDWCCSGPHPERRSSTAVPRLALEHLASMPGQMHPADESESPPLRVTACRVPRRAIAEGGRRALRRSVRHVPAVNV